MFEIMYDDIEVAYKQGNKYKLRENIPRKYIPFGLFVNSDTEDMVTVVNYFCDRAFPENRVDCKRVLKRLGLKRYNEWKIIKRNRAVLITDGWWMKMDEDDNYYKCTWRGWQGWEPASVIDKFHQEPRQTIQA